MVQWQIRRIEKISNGKSVPGGLVAEVTAESGSGSLAVHDMAFKEILAELFEEEQFIMMYADGEDDIYSDGGEVLPPWHPKSLDYARNRLSSYRLMVVEIK